MKHFKTLRKKSLSLKLGKKHLNASLRNYDYENHKIYEIRVEILRLLHWNKAKTSPTQR